MKADKVAFLSFLRRSSREKMVELEQSYNEVGVDDSELPVISEQRFAKQVEEKEEEEEEKVLEEESFPEEGESSPEEGGASSPQEVNNDFFSKFFHTIKNKGVFAVVGSLAASALASAAKLSPPKITAQEIVQKILADKGIIAQKIEKAGFLSVSNDKVSKFVFSTGVLPDSYAELTAYTDSSKTHLVADSAKWRSSAITYEGGYTVEFENFDLDAQPKTSTLELQLTDVYLNSVNFDFQYVRLFSHYHEVEGENIIVNGRHNQQSTTVVSAEGNKTLSVIVSETHSHTLQIKLSDATVVHILGANVEVLGSGEIDTLHASLWGSNLSGKAGDDIFYDSFYGNDFSGGAGDDTIYLEDDFTADYIAFESQDNGLDSIYGFKYGFKDNVFSSDALDFQAFNLIDDSKVNFVQEDHSGESTAYVFTSSPSTPMNISEASFLLLQADYDQAGLAQAFQSGVWKDTRWEDEKSLIVLQQAIDSRDIQIFHLENMLGAIQAEQIAQLHAVGELENILQANFLV